MNKWLVGLGCVTCLDVDSGPAVAVTDAASEGGSADVAFRAMYTGEWNGRKAQRVRAEGALGDRFDLRNFHDAVLSACSVPLPVLNARIARFMAGGGKSPCGDHRTAAGEVTYAGPR